MNRIIKAASLVAMLLTTSAHAASTSLSIIINSAPSTSVTCPLASNYTAPLPAGTTICLITVVPATWSGVLTLSGTNATSFALSGSNLVVGATPLAMGTYSIIINANP